MSARHFVPRIDRWVFKIDRSTVDPETGFLVVDGTASRVGVLEYGKADGAPQDPWFELVPLSTLSNQTLLDSMAGLPITLGHPDELLTSANTDGIAKGAVVRAWMDGDLQRVRMSIWDAATIQGMRDGTRELSLGYHTRLNSTPGTFRGKQFHATQDERKTNHLAIIDFARAGPSAVVDKFDSRPISAAWSARADSLRVCRQRQDADQMDDVEIEIGGVKYMVPAPVAEKIEADRAALEAKPVGDEKDEKGGDGDPPPTPPAASDEKDDEKDKDDKDDEKDEGSGSRGDSAPLTRAHLDQFASYYSTKLLGDMDKRRTDQAAAAESRATLCAKASAVLPEAYKTDGKDEREIMYDGIVAVCPDLKPLATAAREDAAKLAGMFETALAMGRSDSSPGSLKFDSTAEDRDPVSAARTRQDERRKDASNHRGVISIAGARARNDRETAERTGVK